MDNGKAHDDIDEVEVALMTAEYNILLPRLLQLCNGTNTRVCISALLSAAGSICVDQIPEMEQAKKFFLACTHDVLRQFETAYEQKEKTLGKIIEGEAS